MSSQILGGCAFYALLYIYTHIYTHWMYILSLLNTMLVKRSCSPINRSINQTLPWHHMVTSNLVWTELTLYMRRLPWTLLRTSKAHTWKASSCFFAPPINNPSFFPWPMVSCSIRQAQFAIVYFSLDWDFFEPHTYKTGQFPTASLSFLLTVFLFFLIYNTMLPQRRSGSSRPKMNKGKPNGNYCLLHKIYYATTWCPSCGNRLWTSSNWVCTHWIKRTECMHHVNLN